MEREPSKGADFGSLPAYTEFDEALLAISGNRYSAYVSLCRGTDILTAKHLQNPEKSAKGFASVFGLSRIGDNDDLFTIQKKAMQNRYIAAMLAFTSVSGQEWIMDGGGGVICISDTEPGIYRLNVVGEDMPEFILRQGAGVSTTDPLLAEIKAMRVDIGGEFGLRLLTVDGVARLAKVPFEEVERGFDIGTLPSIIRLDNISAPTLDAISVMPPSPEPERPSFSPMGGPSR